MHPMEFIKKHPLEIGAGVVGAIILFRLFGGSGGGGGSGDGGAGQAAYFNAVATQAQSGNALQAVQIQSNAATSQALIGAKASVINNQTWAQAQMQGNDDNIQIAQINSDAAVKIAPYAVQSNLIGTLGSIASKPGSVVTSSSSDSGFFGLGASTSTSSSYVPDPSAVSAGNILGELSGNILGNSAGFSSGNHAAH